MPMLFVNCHRCGRPFPSGIAPTAGVPGGVELLGVLERCPNCAEESRYNTHEYYFPKVAVPTAEAPPTPPPMGTARIAGMEAEETGPTETPVVSTDRTRPANVTPPTVSEAEASAQ